MRVCLQTFGSRGDVEPMVALAAQLTGLGVEVQLFAPRDAEFEAAAHEAGATFHPFGQSVKELVTSGATPAKAPAVAAALVGEWFDTVLPAAEGADALVYTGLMPAGGPSVAQTLGLPSACLLFQSRVLPSPDYPPLGRPGKPYPPDADIPTMWQVDIERADGLYAEPLNRRRAEIGLPPVGNVRDHVVTDHPWLATDPLLDPPERTPGFDVVRSGALFRSDERPLPPALVEFLDAGTPPVFVGFGSMPMHASADVAPLTVAALRARGRRAIVGRGWAGLDLTDADDCFVVDDVNHQALFPRVAAVVHHGGAGTTVAAARAGAPQLIVPQIADQPYWGRRVTALGLGVSLQETGQLATALDTVLTPEIRSHASGVAGSIRVDGVAVVARRVVDLAAGVPA